MGMLKNKECINKLNSKKLERFNQIRKDLGYGEVQTNLRTLIQWITLQTLPYINTLAFAFGGKIERVISS